MFRELTIAQIQQKMASGELTCTQITQYYLDRIAGIDQAGPDLNSIIEINPEALDLADRLDRERQAGRTRGSLHGVPIVLKDNIDTHDRMSTTAGSLALEGRIAAQDAHLVERLRAAGALILAKANLSEWANFRSNRSTSGWSGRGGQTKNPYGAGRNPCGSSSGSAVAVAADLCSVAVGTETDGSIVCPAHTNGIVGIKPTLGLVSRSGIIPIAHSQDTAGPMARSVADAAVLLTALAGPDPRDLATVNAPRIDYTKNLISDGLKGARLGVARNYFKDLHPEGIKVIEAAIQLMKELGAEIVDPADVENVDKLHKDEYEVLLYEFKADLDAYLDALPATARVHSLQDVIDFNQNNPQRSMPWFGQEVMLLAAEKGPKTRRKYLNALARCKKLAGELGIDAALQKAGVDALIAPTGNPAWLTDWITSDHYEGPDTSCAPAVAGYPHITVPAGFVHGLPVGISFIGAAWQEPTLIRLAYAFEQAAQARRAPGL